MSFRRRFMFLQASDPILPLSCSQSPVFLVNSRSPRLSETSICSGSKSHHKQRHTFSRSYGVKLQSSLTRVLSSALEFSSHPPVSVFGTDVIIWSLEAFPGSVASTSSVSEETSYSVLGINEPPDFPGSPPYDLEPETNSGSFSLLRHPIAIMIGAGILTCFPSTTPFGLALGSDSPSAD